MWRESKEVSGTVRVEREQGGQRHCGERKRVRRSAALWRKRERRGQQHCGERENEEVNGTVPCEGESEEVSGTVLCEERVRRSAALFHVERE